MSHAEAEPASDAVLGRLSSYAAGLQFDALTPAAVHAAKVRVIDTLGALMGGFDGEACQVARRIATQAASADGATVIGTGLVVATEMAAFANATT